MICGRKSRTGVWLGLVLFCLCSGLSFGQSSVEIDPLGIYEISGKQLIKSRTEQMLQETQLVALSLDLEMSKHDLTEVQNELTISERAIGELEGSSMRLSELAQSAERRASRYKSLAILLGVTTAGGVLFIVATVLGSPMVAH